MTARWPDRPRVLVSYPYAKTLNADAWSALSRFDLILDSGAYTAARSGTPIDRDAFTAFAAEHRDRFRFTFTLDVIGDPTASFRNFQWQAQQAPHVPWVPTWHVTSPIRELERLCDMAPARVSFGGAVGWSRPRLGRVIVPAHRVTQAHGIPVHGLGMTGEVAALFPWASVDSAAWTIPQRRPHCYLCRRDGTMKSITYGQPTPPKTLDLVAKYGGESRRISDYGFSSAKHVGKATANRRIRWAVTAACRSYMWMETCKRERDTSDFRIYLAATGPDPRIMAAWELGPPWATTTDRPGTLPGARHTTTEV